MKYFFHEFMIFTGLLSMSLKKEMLDFWQLKRISYQITSKKWRLF